MKNTAKWTLGKDEIMQSAIDHANSIEIGSVYPYYICFWEHSGYDELLEYFESKNIGLRVTDLELNESRVNRIIFMIDTMEISDITRDENHVIRTQLHSLTILKNFMLANMTPLYLQAVAREP